jgi:hypothetical protein
MTARTNMPRRVGSLPPWPRAEERRGGRSFACRQWLMWVGRPGLVSRVVAAQWAPARRMSHICAHSVATSWWVGAACSATQKDGLVNEARVEDGLVVWFNSRSWNTETFWANFYDASGKRVARFNANPPVSIPRTHR